MQNNKNRGLGNAPKQSDESTPNIQDQFTVIKIRSEDLKKLQDFKVHRNQPYWEIIKQIIDSDSRKTITKSKEVK